ncbi:guanine nucleotide binding protein, alpha subunit [Obelidium mucronatum]|nr:guanine nucleotide binding protein, alpha subunit [Obelidium mucronatum]
MGCTASTAATGADTITPDPAAIQRNKEIDKQLYEERKKLESVKGTKLLLLGTGETGKSTILKQMRIIYGVGFTQDEIAAFRLTLLSNIFECTQSLMSAMSALKIPYGFDTEEAKLEIEKRETSSRMSAPPAGSDSHLMLLDGGSLTKLDSTFSHGRNITKDNPIAILAKDRYNKMTKKKNGKEAGKRLSTSEQNADKVLDAEALMFSEATEAAFKKGDVTKELIEAVELLWKDSGIQYCYSRANEFQLMECCPYVMANLRRICAPNFAPTEQDIVHARTMTTVITETKFKADGVVYSVFDVGGQRSQRKKWAPFFDDVSAIIFLTAISSYDQTCAEAEGMNRIIESINVFNSIINFPLFKNTGMILFMNKIDLFKEKIKVSPISSFFPAFEGESTYERGIKFFSNEFNSLNKDKSKKIYTHFTWATDTKQISPILKSVRECIEKFNMQQGGLVD